MPDHQGVLQDNVILTMTQWQSASYTLESVKLGARGEGDDRG